MAFLSYNDLERLALDNGHGADGTGTEPIATAAQTPGKTKAMLIGADPSDGGSIRYLGELPVRFFDWQPCRGFFGTERAITLSRLAVKSGWAEDKAQSGWRQDGFQVGDRIVLSEVPPSRCAVATAALKAAYRSKADKPEPEAEIAKDYAALAAWLDGLACDYWETDRGHLTAAIHSFDDPPVFVEDFRFATDRGTAIGICRDYDQCLATLRASPEWAQMRDQALADKRRFWGAKTSFIGLEDEVRTFVEDILELSVRQALAGPAYKVDDANQQKVEAMIGQPVMQEAGRIFNLHLNRLNRRQARRNRPSRPTRDGEIDRQPAPAPADAGFSDDTARRLARQYEVDRAGALFLLQQVEALALYEHEDDLQVRALDLLATVWNLPRPDRRRDLLLTYLDRQLAKADLASALDQAEALVAEATSRF